MSQPRKFVPMAPWLALAWPASCQDAMGTSQSYWRPVFARPSGARFGGATHHARPAGVYDRHTLEGGVQIVPTPHYPWPIREGLRTCAEVAAGADAALRTRNCRVSTDTQASLQATRRHRSERNCVPLAVARFYPTSRTCTGLLSGCCPAASTIERRILQVFFEMIVQDFCFQRLRRTFAFHYIPSQTQGVTVRYELLRTSSNPAPVMPGRIAISIQAANVGLAT
jgi:hypothetical protein